MKAVVRFSVRFCSVVCMINRLCVFLWPLMGLGQLFICLAYCSGALMRLGQCFLCLAYFSGLVFVWGIGLLAGPSAVDVAVSYTLT